MDGKDDTVKRLLVVAAACAAISLASLPGAYASVIEVPIDTVVRAPEGSTTLLATAPVPNDMVSLACGVEARAVNQESVHPGNDLVVASGSESVILADVEREPGTTTVASGSLLLGTSVTVSLVMGPDQVFSGGVTVTITGCTPPTSSTSTTSTTTTQPPSATSTSTTTTLPPSSTTTSQPPVTSSTTQPPAGPTPTSSTTTSPPPSPTSTSTTQPPTATTSTSPPTTTPPELPETGVPFEKLRGVGFTATMLVLVGLASLIVAERYGSRLPAPVAEALAGYTEFWFDLHRTAPATDFFVELRPLADDAT